MSIKNEAEMIEGVGNLVIRISMFLNISLEEAVEMVCELVESTRAEPEKWKKALDIMEALRDNNVDYVYEKYKNDPDVVIGNAEGSSMPFHCIGMTESNHQVPNPSFTEPEYRYFYHSLRTQEEARIWAEIFTYDMVPRMCEFYGITEEQYYNAYCKEGYEELASSDIYWGIVRRMFDWHRHSLEFRKQHGWSLV